MMQTKQLQKHPKVLLPKYRIIFTLLCLVVISGCSQTGYYFQAASGQLSLLSKRTPVNKLLADSATPVELKQKLAKANQMRLFAIDALNLEGNPGFTSYADVGRDYVTWNVVAAPAYSLQPETWCFPIAGCVSYKGYFAKEDAEKFEKTLLAEGKDTLLYGVSAYSTLGWFADPLLNTFIHYSDNNLAALIFHEFAHQLLYVKDDSDFNEAFATAVEEILLESWLKQQGDAEAYAELLEENARQNRVTALILQYREKLQIAYAGANAEAGKPRLFKAMAEEYQTLKSNGLGTRYYDWWFSRPLDNADLLTISTYYQLVPDFLRLFEQHDRDLTAFIAAMQSLAKNRRETRRQVLAGSD